jgi:hypothetical protein
MKHDDSRNDHPNTCFNDQCERNNISNHYNNEQNIELNKESNNNCQGQSFCKQNQDNHIHNKSAVEICNQSSAIERKKKYKVSNKINSDAFLNLFEYSEEKLHFKKPYDRLCYKQKARRLNHITSAIIANCRGDINELINCAYERILHDNTLAKKVILLLMDIRYDLEKKFQLNFEKLISVKI